MYAYIGRQAIYNQDMVVAGYELLYRNGASGNNARIVDDDAATRGVLNDALTVFGISELTGGLPCFINFTRNLLMDDFVHLVDPVGIVIEVPGNIYVDEPLIDKLSELRRYGYRLSLDSYSEFNGTLRFDPIISMFDVVRVNINKVNRVRVKDLVRRLRRSRGAELLAERIETEQDFDNAMDLGFTLFQGYFFEKPVCLSKSIPPLAELSYGRLLNALAEPSVDMERCCRIIESDVVLAYLFLRYTQSTTIYRGSMLGEIRQGMAKMGTDELRRWVSMVLLKQTNLQPTEELAKKAYVRGRFIEQLIHFSETELNPGQGFLMGMFSLLDTVTGVSLQNLLRDMRLDTVAKNAILGREENEYSLFLSYAVIYEMDNVRLILPDIGLKLANRERDSMYQRCALEADALFESDNGSGTSYRGNY